MDELLKSWAGKVPELGALCFIVVAFLKSQLSRDTFIKSLHDEHINARKESREAIIENTESNREVSKTMISLRNSIVSSNLKTND